MIETGRMTFERVERNPEVPKAIGPFVKMTLADENGDMVSTYMTPQHWHDAMVLMEEVCRGTKQRETWVSWRRTT